jgi:arylsulfatase A-like enzyme
MRPTHRASNVFVIAAWAATLFGLLEGAVLCVTRLDPLIEAAHKVSPAVLWVAPVFDIFLFLLVAVAMLVGLRVGRRWLGAWECQASCGFFLFAGSYTVVTAPRIIQPVGAAVLSVGLAVLFCRRLHGSEERLVGYLRHRLIWIPVLIGAAALSIAAYERGREAWLASALPQAPAEARNALVIVLDTVRADRFARPGETSLVPNLDRLAAQGARFENAWSTTSWSLPSQASILTGLYPHEHGADWPRARLGNKHATMAEFFAARGYITGAFSGNAAWMTPEYLGRGFLRFESYQLEDLLRRIVHGRKLDKFILEKVGYHSAGRGKKAPELNAEFLKFVDDYPGRPFFVYLCYMDVNQAYYDRKFNQGGPRPVPVQALVQAYDRALPVLDAQIGELLAELRRRGLLRKTVVVVTSDHGESFGAQYPGDHNPDDHQTSLYREQSTVPLLLFFPDKVPAGRSVSRAVSIRQIPATITQLLSLPDSPFPGDPLSAAWEQEGGTDDSDIAVLAELRNLQGKPISVSVISDHWQYIRNPIDSGEIKKGEELYDLARDPSARHNLAAAPEAELVLERMRKHFERLSTAEAEASAAPSAYPQH